MLSFFSSNTKSNPNCGIKSNFKTRSKERIETAYSDFVSKLGMEGEACQQN